MNRRLLPFVAIILVVLAGLVVVWPRGATLPALPASPGDTTGFHASDVALIGHSGTPQLVEFFHPG
jgi:hypothetical protein